MEGSFRDDLKNIIEFNLVPKVEPNDGEFVLCGEFVDSVPPASTLLRTEDSKDPLSGVITGDNPFGLKELKIIAKDCLQELATIKTDIKDEPEENIYDDSLAPQEVDDPSTDEQIAEHQTKAEPKTGWIYTLRKGQVTEELRKFGLPTKGDCYDQCRLLSNFIRTGYYRPTESKTTDPGTSATSAAAPEDPKSTKAEPKTGWIYTLRKAQVTEELRKFGLPTKGDRYDQCRLLSNFIRTGYYRPTESKTTDPGTSATSAATPEDPKSPVSVSSNSKKRALRIPQSSSAPLPAKKRKKSSYKYEDTSSSESDHDSSYNPRERFGMPPSRKKPSTVKKGKSSKDKRTSVDPIDAANEKLTNESAHRNENALKNPQSDSLSLQEKALLPIKKDSDSNQAWIWCRKCKDCRTLMFMMKGVKDANLSLQKSVFNELMKQLEKTNNAEPRTSWIHALNKARLTEELQKFGLPTKGTCHDQRRLLTDFIRTGYHRPTESKTTDPGTSATSAAAPEDHNSAVEVSLSLKPTTSVSEGEIWSPQSNSASLPETTLPPAKKRNKHSNYKEASSSKNDHDESYNPKRRFSISASGKKTSTVKKGKSNECKKPHLKTVPDKEKLTSDSPQINDNALKNPLTLLKDSVPLPEKASLYVKKNDSDGDKEEVDGVLWSCCDMQFELFSAYNNHKSQVHLIEELKCSVCIDQSFSSIEEIEKHYLDVHTDSSWTSFHCLDCRLVFGVKSSFFEHKAKCSESRKVCSGILNSILDFAVTRKNPKKVKGTGNTAFRLSCCENIIENFEDFFFHKFSDHDISLLTCGLCLCVKDTETQLRSHYRKFHFSKFWKRLELKKCGANEEENDDVLNKADDGPSDSDEVRSKPVQCSALHDGILCQCCDCIKLVEETRSLNAVAIISNLDDRNKPFQCKPCNLRFRYKSRLDRHLRTHEGVKPFPCDICGSAFTKRRSLKNHKLYKHSTNPFQQSCSICDKVLVSKSTLKKHIANVHMHANKNFQFKCEHCGKIYLNRSSFLKHIHSFHTKGKDFVCDHCSKVFYDKRLLISHMQIMHLPNENYECQKCDRTFKTKTYLHAHNMNVHSDRQFYCELCGKMFRTNERFKMHKVGHSDDKPFICQTCGKGFKRYCNLQQHQYTHSDSRPHVCNICGQTFRLRTHVKQHMAVHGIIKNHKCPICEKAFSRKSELKCHLPTHRM